MGHDRTRTCITSDYGPKSVLTLTLRDEEGPVRGVRTTYIMIWISVESSLVKGGVDFKKTYRVRLSLLWLEGQCTSLQYYHV